MSFLSFLAVCVAGLCLLPCLIRTDGRVSAGRLCAAAPLVLAKTVRVGDRIYAASPHGLVATVRQSQLRTDAIHQ